LGWEFIPTLFALNTNTKTMRTITFEGKKINFDLSLGCINDVYVKELNCDFNNLISINQFTNDLPKLIEISRDILLSGHIYWLFCNGEGEKAEEMLTKIKSSKMIATKWVLVAKVDNVLEWISKDFIPSDVELPLDDNKVKKKKS
jgi:hypothetical protein